MFIDTHAHIFKEYFQDIDQVINYINSQNIKCVINNGCDIKSINEVINLSNKYKILYSAIGFHPEIANNIHESQLLFLEEKLNNEKVIAIGEIGLDYHYDGYDKEKQIYLFEKQLVLAENYNLPVIIHSRDATSDTINILKKHKVKGVIHSFTGSLETAKTYINMGFKLGINGVVTFKNCKLIKVLKDLGIENIVLETDSPYLSPEPLRGKQNNSANINLIAKYLCDNLNITHDYLAETTNNNVLDVFDI